MTDATNESAATEAAAPKPKKAAAKKSAAPAKKAPAKKAAAPAKKAAAPKSKALPKADKDKKPKAEKVAKEPVDRSAAVSASWANPEVAAARNQKNKVKVGQEIYRSVLQAFQELKLPINKHIAFRGELKAAGKATFKAEDGTKYNFTLVAAE